MALPPNPGTAAMSAMPSAAFLAAVPGGSEGPDAVEVGQPFGAVAVAAGLVEASMLLAGDAAEVARVIVEGVEVGVVDQVAGRDVAAMVGFPDGDVELVGTLDAAAVLVGGVVDPSRAGAGERVPDIGTTLENNCIGFCHA
jgi:hypothetical protein